MAEKKVTYRAGVEGGAQVKSEFQGIGAAGKAAYEKIEHGTKSAAANSQVFERYLKSETQKFNALRASVDPAFAAVQRFERAERQAARAVQLGIVSKVQADSTLRKYMASMNQLDAVSRRGGRGLHNIALQLNQVGQQAAVTGNVTQALAIQLPDMLAGFGGLAPALIGAGVGLATYLIPQLMKAGDEAKALKIDIQATYGSATPLIKKAEEAQKRYNAAVVLAGRFQKTVTSEVLASLRLEAQARTELAKFESVRLDQQRRALAAGIEAQRARLDGLVARSVATIGSDPSDAFVNSKSDQARVEAVQQVLRNESELVDTIRQQQAELDLVNALMAQNNGAAAETVDKLIEAAKSSGDMSDEMRDALASALGISVSEIGATIGRGADEAARLSGNLSGALRKLMEIQQGMATANRRAINQMRIRESTVGNASARAGGLAAESYREGTGAAAYELIRSGNTGSLSGLGAQERAAAQQAADLAAREAALARQEAALNASSSSGGGGGRSTSSAQRQVNEQMRAAEQIIRATRTEQERYNEAMSQANDLFDAGMLDYETYIRHTDALQESLDKATQAQARFGQVAGTVKNSMIDGLMGQANAADQLRASLKRAAWEYALFGSGMFAQKGSNFQGILGNVFSSILSFDGGGKTPSGPRTGGLDGRGGFMAMLHPDETVIDHTRGQSVPGGRSVVEIALSDGLIGQVIKTSVGQSIEFTGSALKSERRQLSGRVSAYNSRGAD